MTGASALQVQTSAPSLLLAVRMWGYLILRVHIPRIIPSDVTVKTGALSTIRGLTYQAAAPRAMLLLGLTILSSSGYLLEEA